MSEMETARAFLWQTLARLLADSVPDARRQAYARRVLTKLDLAYRTATNQTRRKHTVPDVEALAAAHALARWATAYAAALTPAEAALLRLVAADIPTVLTFTLTHARANQNWEGCVHLAGYGAAATVVQDESPALLCGI